MLGLADGSSMATVLSALGDLAVLDDDWQQAEALYARA
jgi:hypothetical protein